MLLVAIVLRLLFASKFAVIPMILATNNYL